MNFSVRWLQFNGKGELVTKEKHFETAAKRFKFTEKLEKKDNFYCYQAWSIDPDIERR